MILKAKNAATHNATSGKPGVLRDSVVVEVLNPETALFVLSFLPQFIDATSAAPVWLQFLVLGSVVMRRTWQRCWARPCCRGRYTNS